MYLEKFGRWVPLFSGVVVAVSVVFVPWFLIFFRILFASRVYSKENVLRQRKEILYYTRL